MTSSVTPGTCQISRKCLFCWKSVQGDEDANCEVKVRRFWVALQRFTDFPGSRNGHTLKITEQGRCCAECLSLVEGFLEDFYQWKCAELLLNWKVEQFLRILRGVTTQEKGQRKQLRSQVSRACEYGVSHSFPRVRLCRTPKDRRCPPRKSTSSEQQRDNQVLDLKEWNREQTDEIDDNPIPSPPVSDAAEDDMNLDDDAVETPVVMDAVPRKSFSRSVYRRPFKKPHSTAKRNSLKPLWRCGICKKAFPKCVTYRTHILRSHKFQQRTPLQKPLRRFRLKSKAKRANQEPLFQASPPPDREPSPQPLPPVETQKKRYSLRVARKRTYTDMIDKDEEQMKDDADFVPKNLKRGTSKTNSKFPTTTHQKEIGEDSESECSESSHEGYPNPRAYSREKPVHACPVKECGKRFWTPEQLQNHQKLHDTFQCQFCSVTVSFAPDLPIHEMTHVISKDSDRKDKPFACSRCRARFQIKHFLIKHFCCNHLGLSSNANRCPLCREPLRVHPIKHQNTLIIERHLEIIHGVTSAKDPPPDNALRCDLCPSFFLKAKHLNIHKMRDHWNSTCPECPFQNDFNNLRHKWRKLNYHITKKHPHLMSHMPFVCQVKNCVYKPAFRDQPGLDAHMKQVHPVEGFQCHKCEKKFENSMYLGIHDKVVHADRSFVCTECGKTFKTKMTLQQHMEYHKPPEEWKFQCDTCQKRFTDKQKLKEHQRVHTKEKPFVCQFCGVAYGHRHNWRAHMIKHHPQEFGEMAEGQGMKKGKKEGDYMRRKGSKKGDYLMAGVRQQQQDGDDDESN